MTKHYDVIIIGGGAAGMFAALRIGQKKRVLLIEATDRIGKKLLSTGNGQGNLTAEPFDFSRYHGGQAGFAEAALRAFDAAAAVRYFNQLGLVTVVEEGKVFPASKQASSVLDILRLALDASGVTVLTGSPVRSVKKGRVFEVTTENGLWTADNVILSTGGKATPTSPHFVGGYAIATNFGHTLTPLYPSLVQYKCDTTHLKVLKGVRTDVGLSVEDEAGKVWYKGRDEVLFTDYGLSGKVIFAASSYVAGADLSRLTFYLDFLPDTTQAELEEQLYKRKQLVYLKEDVLCGLVKSQIAKAVTARAGKNHALAACLKRFGVQPLSAYSFGTAQVTHGGVTTQQIHPETMESRLVKGLYLIGEMVDVDGDCGGYNLQWCWSSAAAAAKHLTESK